MQQLFLYFFRRQEDGEFYDTCGKAIGFTNWAADEPNNWHGPENCGILWPITGKWNDARCPGKQAFICKFQVPRCKYLTC